MTTRPVAGAPRERPIIFSAGSVRAILQGRKSQTRRLVTGEALNWLAPGMFIPGFVESPYNGLSRLGYRGDRLWVREVAWYDRDEIEGTGRRCFFQDPEPAREVAYRDPTSGSPVLGPIPGAYSPGRYEGAGLVRRSPIFMPRWASRILLEIVGVRIERLRSISPADVIAEGAVYLESEPLHRRWTLDPKSDLRIGTDIAAYAQAWESLHGNRSWRLDPWVWVLEFKRLEVRQ